MKKALLFVLAALCVSAAQAVITGWTTTRSDVDTAGTFSIALVVDLTATDINTNRQYITATGENNTIWAAVGTASASSQGRAWVNDTNTFWSRGTVNEGKNVFGIIFERNVDGKSLRVSYYINETYVNGGSLGTYWSSGFATYDISSIEAYAGQLYFTEGAATAEDFATVPEPTALALLALGVAGLALKRKNA